MVRYLCEVLEVSRSGYYNYFKEESLQKRAMKHQADEVVKEVILKAYRF